MTAELSQEVLDRVEAALQAKHADELRAIMKSIDPGEARQLFGRLGAADAAAVVSVMAPADAADVLRWLAPEQAAEVLSEMAPDVGAAVAAAMPSDERADVLGEMDDGAREAIQSRLPAAKREESERLLEYPPDSAGGLMETELLRYVAGTPVKEVIRDIRANQQRYAKIGVQYIYVVDQDGRLLGAAPMRDLLLAPETATIDSMLRGPVIAAPVTADTPEIADLFDEHHFIGLPVVDASGRLLGVINRADVKEAEHEQSDEQFRLSQGIVGGEELRTMALGKRFRRRTLWLGVNMLLCLGGAFVIANHEETLKKAIVVAAMLPIVSATSGNAAMQAAAVSIRELTLGIVGPRSWMRVLMNEAALAAVMAVPLGVAVAALSLLWDGSGMIALAVGLAMAMNTVLAVGMGALVPLGLRRFGIDPALASGPLTTTMADITGFALLFAWVGWLVM